MRIYVQDYKNVYGIVYMLAPKDNTVHIKLIWLPEHLMSESAGVCHYEVKFEPRDEKSDVYAQRMDGLPGFLLSWHGKWSSGIKIPASENVLRIEHDSDWEFDFLVNMAKQPEWENQDADFNLRAKLGCGVRLKVKELQEKDDWLEVDKSGMGESE